MNSMKTPASRRHFLKSMGTLAVVSAFDSPTAQAVTEPKGMRFGYTAMTWGKEEKQAIDDISSLGFAGIQFRIDAVSEFKPPELRDILAQHKLTFVALSSGEVAIDPAVEAAEIAKHTANAKFVRDAGGLYLQVLDQLKPYPRTVTPAECKRLGKLLTAIGKQTADLGVPLGYHNHMNTISEHPANLATVLEDADPQFVKLELDTAHALAGGGDPAAMVEQYRDRLLFLHLKDVVSIPLGSENSKYPFKFVELGRGDVDFPSVFATLKKIGFTGWAVVELDRVPDPSRTPKDCAKISSEYLASKFAAKF
jgi:inosose dehydratase